MAGNTNNFFILILLTFLGFCKDLPEGKGNGDVYIKITKDVNYNNDIIEYFLVNNTNSDLKILCNPNFFKREKDSLFIDALAHPLVKVYNNTGLVQPVVLKVHFTAKVLDSLSALKEDYVEVPSLNNVDGLRLDILKKYVVSIKSKDSLRFVTTINFENEPRSYDYSEIEGYILSRDEHYFFEIRLNDNLHKEVKRFLEKENIYSVPIYSNRRKLNFIKSIYSE